MPSEAEPQHKAEVLAMTSLSDRYERALAYAIHIHASQLRKGTSIPYIAHLLHVSALVIEDGGNEDEAIAGLLHDAVEDQGGSARLKDIRARFGDAVADIVESCSDTDAEPKPPWRPRKEAYVQHLKTASPSVLRVSLADKLHNAGAILQDYRREGDSLFKRFNAGKEEQRWYYEALLATFKSRSASPLVQELDRVVTELGRLLA
jgi:(p)ppGpp synthase/HD superfamily hydrolase